MAHTLTLKKANHRRVVLETTDRYDLLLNGARVGNVYFNMRGYLIDSGLPLPGGGRLQLPESSLSAIRCEIAAINREARAPGHGRIYENMMTVLTPWGVAQTSRTYAEGIVFHATASHGGFHLDAGRNVRIPDEWRTADGWYEEDCAWAAVAMTFPTLFTQDERQIAERIMRHRRRA